MRMTLTIKKKKSLHKRQFGKTNTTRGSKIVSLYENNSDPLFVFNETTRETAYTL